jgi:selenide, water dikinase
MRLVLAGCGHAHLFVLEALARGTLTGAAAVLVSPAGEYYYSGMIPGVIAGNYTPGEARLLPARLAAAAGAQWLETRVTEIEPAARRVRLADGTRLDFDLLSLDIGAALSADEVPGMRQYAVPVKPMGEALRAIERVRAASRGASSDRPARILVVGGGAAGVELSFCLHQRLESLPPGTRWQLTVVEAGPRILPEYSAGFRRRAARLFAQRGIETRTATRIVEVRQGSTRTGADQEIPYDVLVWATGPRARALFREAELSTDASGYLLVHPTLQAVDSPVIFAAGDCCSLVDHEPVPKAGVYAVRQGPLLAQNLQRYLRRERLRRYSPQRHWLSLMNTGDSRALLHYRGRAAHARLAWWLKDWIDRRFVRRFQQLGT